MTVSCACKLAGRIRSQLCEERARTSRSVSIDSHRRLGMLSTTELLAHAGGPPPVSRRADPISGADDVTIVTMMT